VWFLHLLNDLITVSVAYRAEHCVLCRFRFERRQSRIPRQYRYVDVLFVPYLLNSHKSVNNVIGLDCHGHELWAFGYIVECRGHWLSFRVVTDLCITICTELGDKASHTQIEFSEKRKIRAITPFKVIKVGMNRKPVCDILLVINSNWQLTTYLIPFRSYSS